MNKRTTTLIKKIPGWLTTKESHFLEKIARQTKSVKGEIVEIGSFYGKSTISLAQAKGKVYAVDPHKGNIGDGMKFPPSYKGFRENMKKAQVSSYVVPLVSTSKDASRGWNKKIRVLFIDALHDKENAARDYKVWSKYVTDGGIIAMHDAYLRWCGSETVAMQKIIRSSDFYKIGVVDSIVYGIKGKGTLLQRIEKIFWQAYILTRVYLNRAIIVLLNTLAFKNASPLITG